MWRAARRSCLGTCSSRSRGGRSSKRSRAAATISRTSTSGRPSKARRGGGSRRGSSTSAGDSIACSRSGSRGRAPARVVGASAQPRARAVRAARDSAIRLLRRHGRALCRRGSRPEGRGARVRVDGTLTERVVAEKDLSSVSPPLSFRVDGIEAHETFTASPRRPRRLGRLPTGGRRRGITLRSCTPTG